VRCHGNTFVADNNVLARRIDGMGTCAEILVTKVGREVARLAKEESRLIPERNDVSVETRKGLQMAIVICMYFVGMYVDYL